jgi:hypothetical protein
MAFLNKKERVLDIELSQHGKRLLSQGKLMPAFYAFFDDDVVYDSEYGHFVENRSEASDRIRNDTPTTTAQYVFSGIETDITKAVTRARKKISKGEKNIRLEQATPEKHFAISAPIGNSSLAEDKMPAWSVSFLKSKMTGSVENMTGSQPTLKIPQLNMETIEYKTIATQPDVLEEDIESSFGDAGDAPGTVSDMNFASARFEDGSFVKIKEDFALLEITEENVDSLSKNFDIEVFIEETDDKTGQRIFSQLFFNKTNPLIKDDILLEQDNLGIPENTVRDPTYVDHFFHIYVDDEINKDVLCKYVSHSSIEAAFPADFLDCQDREDTPSTGAPSLYGSDVTEEDLEEDC